MFGGKSTADVFKSIMNQERQLNAAKKQSEESKNKMQLSMGEQASTTSKLNKKMQENIDKEIERKDMENKFEKEKYKHRSPLVEGILESAGPLTGIGGGLIGGGIGSILGGAARSRTPKMSDFEKAKAKSEYMRQMQRKNKRFKFKKKPRY